MAATQEMTTPVANLVGHWIDGSERSNPGATAEIPNPDTGEVIRRVLLGTAADVDLAVGAARAAGPAWGDLSVGRRSKVMREFARLIDRDSRKLTDVISEEGGKIRADAAAEVARAMDLFDVTDAARVHLAGVYSDEVSSGHDVYSLRQPLGVAATITPFNFPILAPLNLVTFALVCGNAVIHKPSERTPSASLMLARLLQEAGVPDGVFNIVNGDRVAVDALLDHPGIDSVSFIGSTPVAEHVRVRGVTAGKRVQAFGGAKNHMVVMPDADLGLAADGAVSAAFGAAGQRCMAISTAVAVGATGDRFVEILREKSSALKTGSTSDPESEVGPLITATACERVGSALSGAEAEGATIVLDGRAADPGGDGFFVAPSIVDGVTSEMEVYQREIFGPVLVVMRAADLDEAIQLVSDNKFGNGATVYTTNGRTGRRFVRETKVGMVGINVPIPLPVASHSFGGWKDSFFGEHNMTGPDGFRFFTLPKTATVRWPEQDTSDLDLVFPTSDDSVPLPSRD